MALVELARYHTLSEAEVAASVLRSADIETMVADAHYGSVFWIEQSALGGYRLLVLDEDLTDATAILRAPSEPADIEDDPEAPASLTAGQRVAAVGLGLTVGPAAGWLATGGRVRPTLVEAGTGAAIALVLLIGGGAAFAVLALILQLLTNPP